LSTNSWPVTIVALPLPRTSFATVWPRVTGSKSKNTFNGAKSLSEAKFAAHAGSAGPGFDRLRLEPSLELALASAPLPLASPIKTS